MHDTYLYAEFNGTINIDYDRPGRHPDLLPKLSGEYKAVGMLENDRIIITYRPVEIKPNPPFIDVEKLQREWIDEQVRKRAAFLSR